MGTTEPMAANLGRLKPSGTSPVNTPTCPDRSCTCGAKLKGFWVDRAEFAGKVYQEAGWTFADLCDTCEFNKSQESVIPFDPKAHEARCLAKLEKIFGGERPGIEYTWDRYEVDLENGPAFQSMKAFNPKLSNVFLHGPCGVGKTHLACAAVREVVWSGGTAVAMKPSRLTRYLRVKESDVQEARLRELASVDVLLIDELGIGSETAFARQCLQEIMDMRKDNYRNGLIVTSNYSLDEYASKLGEDPIPSRLAELCQVVKVAGADRRMKARKR